MKSEKGITLVSLIIYVIAMLITVTIISVITSYFYKNGIDVTAEKYTYISEFTSAESYFSAEANREENKVLEIKEIKDTDENVKQRYIAFSSGNQYTFVLANKALYQNNIKIASGVEECTFGEQIQNGKPCVSINLKIQDKIRTFRYALIN